MALSIYNSMLQMRNTVNEEWKENLQAFIDHSFDNSPSVFDIEEEDVFGTQTYTALKVRINHIINASTGNKVGDDWKEIKFQDISTAKGMGCRYRFDNNIWMSVNSDIYKFVTKSNIIRRCNNTWKYLDSTGAIVEEPCVIDYVFTSTNFDYDEAIITPKGDLFVALQANAYSRKIKINDRVVFDGQPFKVTAINTFGRRNTFDPTSVTLLYFDITKDAIAEDDDLTNNIANTNRYSYTLNVIQPSVVNSVGYSTTLTAETKFNGSIVAKSVIWSSSNTNIATVSNVGLLTLISNGACTITCALADNTDVKDTVAITVQAVPTNVVDVRIVPNLTSLLKGESRTYTVYKFVNNVQQANTFTFVGSGVPSANYTLTVNNGNSFTVLNKEKYDTPLTVTCTSGTDVQTIQITLKGAW